MSIVAVKQLESNLSSERSTLTKVLKKILVIKVSGKRSYF